MANFNALHGPDGRFPRIPIEDQFWSHTRKTDSCWIWTGEVGHDGYGKIRVEGKHIGAHRLSLIMHGRKPADGLTVDHLCRVRNCVNPEHLESVTLRENLLRGDNVCMAHAKKTHCIRGHEITGSNLRMQGRYRVCRECEKIRSVGNNAARRAKYARNKNRE